MSDWYAIVDAARDHRLQPLVAQCSQVKTLYDEPLNPDMVPVAPYLAALHENEPLLATWRRHGRGKSWGILVESDADFGEIRTHFRKFLKARLPGGALVMFRFYDPRVLGPYLLSASAADLAPIFTKVRQFIVEAEDGVQHSYRWRRGMLFDGNTPAGQSAADQGALHAQA